MFCIVSKDFPFFHELVKVVDVCFRIQIVLKTETNLLLDLQYSSHGYLSSYLGITGSLNFCSNQQGPQSPQLKVLSIYSWHFLKEKVNIVASKGKHFSRIVSTACLLLEPFHHILSQT